tara:strand:+ start:1040 stop:1201 length:162 start_codon:yes stop_codon:yes gene_type:complete
MVSVTVLVVVVFDVIEPWVKFGTTGTAFAAVVPQNITAMVVISLFTSIKPPNY